MRVLNIGCGPVVHGNYPGIEIVCADKRAHEGADIVDMENLPYKDNCFDIVACINALDHTPDASKALEELIRVGRYIYIDCALIQKTTSGRNHYWDMEENGTLKNEVTSIPLKSLGFDIELIDNGMERRYNHIIARLNK